MTEVHYPHPDAVKKLQNAHEAVETALKGRWERLQEVLQPGTLIHWWVGNNRQCGFVQCIIGGWWSPSVRVRNTRTDKVVDLDIARLEEVNPKIIERNESDAEPMH